MKIHEKYNPIEYFKNDIALIRVSEPIKFDEKVNKVSLQTQEFDEDESSAILTGWGSTEVESF